MSGWLESPEQIEAQRRRGDAGMYLVGYLRLNINTKNLIFIIENKVF
jgi:hypothetical protein